MPLVTVDGFSEKSGIEFLPVDNVGDSDSSIAVDIPNDVDPVGMRDQFHRIHTIRIEFPSSADGRGFSLARQLRNLGYEGRIRAQGPLISDQFRYALSCGFDEVEIDNEMAERQPESHWKLDDDSDDSDAVSVRDVVSYRDKLSSPPKRTAVNEDVYHQKVIDVQHYSDTLFRFKITRPDSFRFQAGEFVMIGLEGEGGGKDIYRAYSICSATWDDHIEFYSIKAPDGELTRRLKWIRSGDTILLKKKSTGSLVSTAMTPGKRLFLHSTGTGIAPFLSLIQEPSLYEQYEKIILTHTGRTAVDLEYGKEQILKIQRESLIQEQASSQLTYFGTTTQEDSENTGRITDLIESKSLFRKLEISDLDAETDRVMVCGSKSFNSDMKALFTSLGFTHGSLRESGTFLWERAFAD